MQNNNYKLHFIGAGNIANAMISGLINSGFPSLNIYVYDKDPVKTLSLVDKFNINDHKELSFLDEGYLFICVKPADYTDLLEEIKEHIGKGVFVLSCMAGISLERIDKDFEDNICLRFMPNMLIENSSGFIALTSSSKNLINDFMSIFSEIADIREIPEDMFDVITAAAGSGPAWIYYYINSLIKAGCKNVLNEEESKTIVLSLLKGASNKLTQDTDLNQLIQEVSSPGGTTEAGLKIIEEANVDEIISDVISKATKRSKELREDSN